MFCEKRKTYHAAAGEPGHYRAQTPSLQTQRVTRVSYRRYAVVDLAERLLLLERGECHPEREVGTPPLAFFRHHPLHMLRCDRSRSLLRMWSSFWDQL
jgi:hypothetical protein